MIDVLKNAHLHDLGVTGRLDRLITNNIRHAVAYMSYNLESDGILYRSQVTTVVQLLKQAKNGLKVYEATLVRLVDGQSSKEDRRRIAKIQDECRGFCHFLDKCHTVTLGFGGGPRW